MRCFVCIAVLSTTGCPMSESEHQTAPGKCEGKMLRVPYDCGTIQQAVNAAGSQPMDSAVVPHTIIVISSGVYHENINVPMRVDIAIVRENSAAVLIDGGAMSAITVDFGATLRLQDVTVMSAQTDETLHYPTIKAGDVGTIELDSVTIRTNHIGLLVTQEHSIMVTNSTIIGNGSVGSVGIYVGVQTGNAIILSNKFQNFSTGIRVCSGSAPNLSAAEPGDSNEYERVTTPYNFLSSGCE